MEQFVEFASQLIPNYKQLIRGASSEEIMHFEQLVGFPLPQTYKEYLFQMGHNNGGVELICDGTTDLTDLIEFYEQEIVPGYDEAPPDCIIIGIGGTIVEEISLQFAPFLEPRMVFSGGGIVNSLCAESFDKFIFRSVFIQEQHRTFSHFRPLISTNNKLLIKQSHDIAVSLGFQPLWFSDSIAFCGKKDHATISMIQGEHSHALTIKIATQQESEMNRIMAVLTDKLGVNSGFSSSSPDFATSPYSVTNQDRNVRPVRQAEVVTE
jgi:hypothetical protein